MGRLRHAQNTKFYEDCAEYFKALRSKGSTDFAFEDEYYFTMPGISGRIED